MQAKWFSAYLAELKQLGKIKIAASLTVDYLWLTACGYRIDELAVHFPEGRYPQVVPLSALAKWPKGKPPAKGTSEP
jgi:hypothetical protein